MSSAGLAAWRPRVSAVFTSFLIYQFSARQAVLCYPDGVGVIAMLDKRQQKSELIPLRVDKYGTVRVGGTRVTLESIVTAFELGATSEQIVHKFPSLKLDDVYAVITYYLRNRAEVKAYLAEDAKEADAVQAKIEAGFPSNGIRERLLARRKEQNASSC